MATEAQMHWSQGIPCALPPHWGPGAAELLVLKEKSKAVEQPAVFAAANLIFLKGLLIPACCWCPCHAWHQAITLSERRPDYATGHSWQFFICWVRLHGVLISTPPFGGPHPLFWVFSPTPGSAISVNITGQGNAVALRLPWTNLTVILISWLHLLQKMP